MRASYRMLLAAGAEGRPKMTNAVKVVLFLALLISAVALAQDSPPAPQPAPQGEEAYRAAWADAIDNLTKRIKGLSITAETTVAGMLAENEAAEAALTAFLLGQQASGAPVYSEEGGCQLTVQLAFDVLVNGLKLIHNRYCGGDQLTEASFEKMLSSSTLMVLAAKGTGSADTTPMTPVISAVGSVDSGVYLFGEAEAFWNSHCTTHGRVLAIRAAREDGLRRLADRVGEAVIDSGTTVGGVVDELDFPELTISQFLPVVGETQVRYAPDRLVVEVTLEVVLQDVMVCISRWLKDQPDVEPTKIRQLERIIVAMRRTPVSAEGMGSPPVEYVTTSDEKVVAAVALVNQRPDWIYDTLRAVGRSVVDERLDDQARAGQLALAAAELDAWQKLIVALNSLSIGTTTVGEVAVGSDSVRRALLACMMETPVPGDSRQVLPDGAIEAAVEIDLHALWRAIVMNI